VAQDLFVIGLNHRTAAVDVRERVAVGPDQALSTLADLRCDDSLHQALLLSTCNRTELYGVTSDVDRTLPRVRQRVFDNRLGSGPSGSDTLFEHRDGETVRHLFRVACGLDSMVLGENEILGQVKAAYELSRTARTVGTVLHRLAARAFHVGKRARTETAIDTGAASVAHAAVELAEKVFASLAGHGVLLVGAGRNGALCAEHLAARQVAPLLIANRSFDKAEQLAARLGGEAVRFERLSAALSAVDIVISTTGADRPVLGHDLVAQAMKARGDRRMVFIDIAVPRDVAPEVERIPRVFVFGMHALESIVEQTVASRREAVPQVERLVTAEAEGFMRWLGTLDAGPTIRDLHHRFESIAEAELARNARRFEPGDRPQLDRFTHLLVRKLLMGVTKEIKRYHVDDPVEAERLATLREVFHLDSDDESSER